MSFLQDRFDALARALDRRIDNELNAEFMPSPQQMQSGEVTVTTSDDERGITKAAGTGGRFIPQVPNSILYVGIAAIGAVIAWQVVK